jgi:hypothetical protein
MFIDSMKSIQFLVEYNYEPGSNKIQKHLASGSSNSELISLKGSVLDYKNLDVCWLRLPILPTFCQAALGDWTQHAGVVTEISAVIVAENLCKLVERLEAPLMTEKGKLALNEIVLLVNTNELLCLLFLQAATTIFYIHFTS